MVKYWKPLFKTVINSEILSRITLLYLNSGSWNISQNSISNTVKSHFKVLGLYNFIRVFEWAYKCGGGGGGGLYPGGLIIYNLCKARLLYLLVYDTADVNFTEIE